MNSRSQRSSLDRFRNVLNGLGALALTLAFISSAPAPPAHAAAARGVLIASPASGPGTVDITIESFGKPDLRDPDTKGTQSPQTLISVPISSGSSPYNTASLIEAALNAALGPSIVTRHRIFNDPSVDLLAKDTGTFTMSIVENVPGQTIAETSPLCCPAVSPWGVLVVSGLILLAGLAKFRGLETHETS